MRKNKQTWFLDADEVERIKAGVLRYIQSNQNSRSRQKSSYSHTSSTPRTPLPNPSSETLKKSRTKQKESMTTLHKEKTYKLRQPKKKDETGSMPNGFQLSKSGKILRTQPIQTKELTRSTKQKVVIKEEIVDTRKKLIQPHQPSPIFEITNSDEEIFVKVSPEPKLQKEIKRNETQQQKKTIEQQKPLLERVGMKSPQTTLKKQEPVEETKPFSVLQLAKLFGGGGISKKIESAPSPEKNASAVKAQITDRSSVEKQVTFQSGEKINANQINSLASFGKSQNSKSNMRIIQFLDMRVAEAKKKQPQKERKRSYTFQENMASHESQPVQPTSILLQQSRKNIDKEKQSHKYFTQSKSKILVPQEPIQLRSIEFNQQQQQQLKVKYSILSRKLDELKYRVLEQCDYMQKVRVQSRSPKEIRKQKVRLYNKYSPLKNLERIQNQKIQERKINEIEKERSRFIKFQKSLRLG